MSLATRQVFQMMGSERLSDLHENLDGHLYGHILLGH